MKKLLIILLLSMIVTTIWAQIRSVTLSIPGMNCPICSITVKKALEKIEGVEKVDVVYEDRIATVTFDDTKVDVIALTQVTKEAGYPSSVEGN